MLQDVNATIASDTCTYRKEASIDASFPTIDHSKCIERLASTLENETSALLQAIASHNIAAIQQCARLLYTSAYSIESSAIALQ